MMKNIIGFLFILLLTACGSTPTTKVDYNEETNFSEFKSFHIGKSASTSADANPILLSRIEKAIKNTLMQKPLTVQSESPDLLVTFHYAQQEKPNNSSFSIGLGGSSMGSRSSTGVGVSTSIPLDSSVTVITKIFIDISHNGKAVWHGTDIYEGEGDMPAMEKEKVIATTVSRLLAGFPPKK
jgi:hypothetical protein